VATYGVTDQGFIRKPLAVILEEKQQEAIDLFGASVDLDPDSPVGRQLAIQSAGEDKLWQLAEAQYAQGDRRSATGAGLDAIGALTGTERKDPTFSTGLYLAAGAATTLIPIGSQPTNPAGDIRFETTAGATLGAATAWASSATVATGVVRTKSGRVYVALIGGVTGSTGPSGSSPYPAREVDGTVTWVFLASGDGYVSIPIQATVEGAVAAPAFSLTGIGTPVTGWNGGGNFEDCITGNGEELDPPYRQRQVLELRAMANAAVEAIRGRLLKLEIVTACTVFDNPSDYTVDGMPPHSVEPLVSHSGPTPNQDVLEAIFETVAAGIQTTGNVTGTVVDSQGLTHTVKYSVPIDVDVYAEATLYVLFEQWPEDGEDLAAAALLAFGDALEAGYDVEPSKCESAVDQAVPGILAAVVKVSLAAISGATPRAAIELEPREKADFDSSRISIVVVPRSP
jgi:uncharacterized phage protein gp47/JayE